MREYVLVLLIAAGVTYLLAGLCRRLAFRFNAVALVREGFARGGFTYNDVMSAHAALLQTKARRVAVLQTFHNDRARLDRLTGAHADLLGLETQP